MEDMLKKLIAGGCDAAIAASLVASFKPPKEKKEKKKGKWYPGMETTSTKVETEVDVYTRCVLCNEISHQKVTMKIDKKSPTEQKVTCSVCKHCPDYLGQFTSEELISIILLGEKPQPELHLATVKMRAKLARKLTPIEVVNFVNAMPTLEVKNASNIEEGS